METDEKVTYCVYLELEPYLRQWVIHYCGGVTPVSFPKNSIENIHLANGLIKRPGNVGAEVITPDLLEIAIPEFKAKDPATYNYLPKPARFELIRTIRRNFRLDLWSNLHRFGWIGRRRDKLIEAYMIANGIEVDDTNTNTILKIYQRAYKTFLENKNFQRRKTKKNK
ncbi:MAG: hypothetical protein J1E63_10365 [Muribaculaceae bacterium]|nr:hypothetical protein [Muribaculaceae bacterium]